MVHGITQYYLTQNMMPLPTHHPPSSRHHGTPRRLLRLISSDYKWATMRWASVLISHQTYTLSQHTSRYQQKCIPDSVNKRVHLTLSPPASHPPAVQCQAWVKSPSPSHLQLCTPCLASSLLYSSSCWSWWEFPTVTANAQGKLEHLNISCSIWVFVVISVQIAGKEEALNR